MQGTNLRGISAVAAPLFDHGGQVCAVLTALGASGGFDASEQGPVAQALRAEAAALSQQLGYRGPTRPPDPAPPGERTF